MFLLWGFLKLGNGGCVASPGEDPLVFTQTCDESLEECQAKCLNSKCPCFGYVEKHSTECSCLGYVEKPDSPYCGALCGFWVGDSTVELNQINKLWGFTIYSNTNYIVLYIWWVSLKIFTDLPKQHFLGVSRGL